MAPRKTVRRTAPGNKRRRLLTGRVPLLPMSRMTMNKLQRAVVQSLDFLGELVGDPEVQKVTVMSLLQYATKRGILRRKGEQYMMVQSEPQSDDDTSRPPVSPSPSMDALSTSTEALSSAGEDLASANHRDRHDRHHRRHRPHHHHHRHHRNRGRSRSPTHNVEDDDGDNGRGGVGGEIVGGGGGGEGGVVTGGGGGGGGGTTAAAAAATDTLFLASRHTSRKREMSTTGSGVGGGGGSNASANNEVGDVEMDGEREHRSPSPL